MYLCVGTKMETKFCYNYDKQTCERLLVPLSSPILAKVEHITCQ